jgi:hypothetical protein
MRLVRGVVEGSNPSGPATHCQQIVQDPHANAECGPILPSCRAEAWLMKGVGEDKYGARESDGKERSCTKHGFYSGPYCPKCYETTFGAESPAQQSQNANLDSRD